ncbi:MAG TPA: alkaline phosphatase family protein [Vicinamibacterales bacterium]|jgi:predicted AlkP superfamily phosphohydrolase/phosphomutase
MRTTVWWLTAGVLAVAALSLACSSSSSRGPGTHRQKLVILGFDGMDPHLLQKWMAEGKLPHISALAKQGGFYPLQTTHSPESPTAWASFATGVNAGKHNIYDFLVRDTNTYLPDLGMVTRTPPRFLFNYLPISKPRVTSTRGGTSFWVTAGKAGVRSDMLTVPVTFPPEDVDNGELLSGLPLPDIRGTMGTFSYYATDLSRYEEGNTEMGGILKRLVFEGDTASSELEGPPSPIVRQQIEAIRRKTAPLGDADKTQLAELQAVQDVRIPFTVKWDRAGKRAAIDIDGQHLTLEPGKWTPWIDLTFKVNLLVRVHGMTQMLLENAGNELQLLVSPVNFKPDDPPVPMSYPASFAGDLYKAVGNYRTLGWAEETWALNEGRMDEKTFMDDLMVAFDDRARVILNRVDQKDWDLLVGVIESTDRVQHMMWRLIDPKHPLYDATLAARYGDSIERVYRRADDFVGEVVTRVGPDVPVMIVSDHGFHSWRKAVNLDTWLVQNGYMVMKGQSADKKLSDLFGGGTFWENVDWSRTRAYAMGIGQIYFNLRGRESQGIVSPGAEATALADEISAKLLTLADPEDGTHIVRAVYKRDDIYSGPYLSNAAELQVGMDEGYRVSWQTTLGGSPQGIVYKNDRKWSADHGGYDYLITSGVFVSSRPIATADPRIIDIAPTVLKFFGVGIPSDIDGKPLF